MPTPPPAPEVAPTDAQRSGDPGPGLRRGRGLLLGAGLLTAGVLIGAALSPLVAGAAAADPLAAVETAYDLLIHDFAGKIDPAALIAGAIQGMAASTGDRFTEYLPPTGDQSLTDQLDGFSGIGVVLQALGGGDVITSVLAAGAADKAGLRSGDLIVAVDGHSTQGIGLDQVSTWVRGDAGTKVTIDVVEPGTETPVPYTLVRMAIDQPTVFASSPSPGMGLIRISEFSSTTGDAFDKAYAGLQAARGGLSGLILDLRGNPGGYVDAAMHIAEELAPPGPLLVITDGAGNVTKYSASAHAAVPPIVILTDNNTASAAEILAGALQYSHAALLVGQTTYGKGSVQQLFSLSSGGALKITTAHDALPDGTSWDHKGLQPDIPVTPPPSALQQLPTFAAVGTRDLKAGDVGLDVLGLQQRLSVLGRFQGTPDGVYSAMTTAAVQVFQEAAGLKVTGEMTSTDWDALSKALAARVAALKAEVPPDVVLQKGETVLAGLMAGGGAQAG